MNIKKTIALILILCLFSANIAYAYTSSEIIELTKQNPTDSVIVISYEDLALGEYYFEKITTCELLGN